MNIVKTIAVAAVLFAGVSAASASTLTSQLSNYGALENAMTASVQTVTDTEARLLRHGTDVKTIQARIQNNSWLKASIERQGFDVENIVGAAGGENDLTLFAI